VRSIFPIFQHRVSRCYLSSPWGADCLERVLLVFTYFFLLGAPTRAIPHVDCGSGTDFPHIAWGFRKECTMWTGAWFRIFACPAGLSSYCEKSPPIPLICPQFSYQNFLTVPVQTSSLQRTFPGPAFPPPKSPNVCTTVSPCYTI